MRSKPYPSDFEAIMFGMLYRPEPWRVRSGGGVFPRTCRAEISRPRAWAVSNQCAHGIEQRFGRYGFCRVHAREIVRLYRVSLQLTAVARESHEVNY